jgi:SAM-dependent methyltransferase
MIAKKLKAVLPRSLRRPLGITRRWLRALPSRTRKQKEELLASPALSSSERELLRNVESRIFHEDGMYVGDGDHYFRVGLSAIHCIDDALEQAPIESVRRILDLPCGYGRVMRFLVRRFPEARITACELAQDAVRFCVETFGAVPAISRQNPAELSFDEQFDLIWCGSLFTHLDEASILALLDLFRRSLAPGGVALFTTHGERVVDRMLADEYDYSIARDRIPAMLDSYRRTGFGFTDYLDVTSYGVATDARYGISLTAPDWIRERAARVGGLHEIFFRPHGWDDHQDVFGFIRRTET